MITERNASEESVDNATAEGKAHSLPTSFFRWMKVRTLLGRYVRTWMQKTLSKPARKSCVSLQSAWERARRSRISVAPLIQWNPQFHLRFINLCDISHCCAFSLTIIVLIFFFAYCVNIGSDGTPLFFKVPLIGTPSAKWYSKRIFLHKGDFRFILNSQGRLKWFLFFTLLATCNSKTRALLPPINSGDCQALTDRNFTKPK
jgi:hypothetical protein